MPEPETTAQDALRDGILASGHNDFVSMADMRSRRTVDGWLAEAEHHDAAVAATRRWRYHLPSAIGAQRPGALSSPE